MQSNVIRRWLRGMVAIVVVGAVAVVTAGPAVAGPVTGPGKARPKLIKVEPSPGAVAAFGSGLAGNIRNPNSGRCIGIANGLAGIWDCTTRPDQMWHWVSDRAWYCQQDNPNFCWHQLENDDHRCLAIEGGNHNAGDRALGFDCTGSADQYWQTFWPNDRDAVLGNMNGFYSSSNNWVIGVGGGRIDNGAPVVQWWDDSTPNQRWALP